MRYILTLVMLGSALLSHASQHPAAKDFLLPLLGQPQQLSLSEQNGKVVYLDFWASWCGPCRQSLPLLNELRQDLHNNGMSNDFEILAINLDDSAADGLSFLQQHPVDYPVLHDPAGSTSDDYGVRGMPTSYLIDRQGKLRAVHQGFKPADIDGIRSAIEQLLQEQ